MFTETKGLKFNPDELVWRKSSYSASVANCLQVAYVTDGSGAVVGVVTRDSETPDASPQVYTASQWRAFTGGAKKGEFDI